MLFFLRIFFLSWEFIAFSMKVSKLFRWIFCLNFCFFPQFRLFINFDTILKSQRTPIGRLETSIWSIMNITFFLFIVEVFIENLPRKLLKIFAQLLYLEILTEPLRWVCRWLIGFLPFFPPTHFFTPSLSPDSFAPFGEPITQRNRHESTWLSP